MEINPVFLNKRNMKKLISLFAVSLLLVTSIGVALARTFKTIPVPKFVKITTQQLQQLKKQSQQKSSTAQENTPEEILYVSSSLGGPINTSLQKGKNNQMIGYWGADAINGDIRITSISFDLNSGGNNTLNYSNGLSGPVKFVVLEM